MMLELLSQENSLHAALGATILIWTIIGGTYFRLVLGKRIAR